MTTIFIGGINQYLPQSLSLGDGEHQTYPVSSFSLSISLPLTVSLTRIIVSLSRVSPSNPAPTKKSKGRSCHARLRRIRRDCCAETRLTWKAHYDRASQAIPTNRLDVVRTSPEPTGLDFSSDIFYNGSVVICRIYCSGPCSREFLLLFSFFHSTKRSAPGGGGMRGSSISPKWKQGNPALNASEPDDLRAGPTPQNGQVHAESSWF